MEGLDLSNYVVGPVDPANPPVYDLYAVSHHSGGMGGGHYTAVCKNALNNKWYVLYVHSGLRDAIGLGAGLLVL